MKFFIVIVNNLVTCDIQELSGVGDDDHCIFTVSDVVLQPHDCIQIQMVCRLVE